MKSNSTGWGYFEQGSDQLQEIMELGAWLNTTINCPVHYPAFGKRLFECKCNVIFPVYVVAARDKNRILQIHSGGSSNGK